jgi:hypothetical protein
MRHLAGTSFATRSAQEGHAENDQPAILGSGANGVNQRVADPELHPEALAIRADERRGISSHLEDVHVGELGESWKRGHVSWPSRVNMDSDLPDRPDDERRAGPFLRHGRAEELLDLTCPPVEGHQFSPL